MNKESVYVYRLIFNDYIVGMIMEMLFEKLQDNNNVSIIRNQDPPFPSLSPTIPPSFLLPSFLFLFLLPCLPSATPPS